MGPRADSFGFLPGIQTGSAKIRLGKKSSMLHSGVSPTMAHREQQPLQNRDRIDADRHNDCRTKSPEFMAPALEGPSPHFRHASEIQFWIQRREFATSVAGEVPLAKRPRIARLPGLFVRNIRGDSVPKGSRRWSSRHGHGVCVVFVPFRHVGHSLRGKTGRSCRVLAVNRAWRSSRAELPQAWSNGCIRSVQQQRGEADHE